MARVEASRITPAGIRASFGRLPAWRLLGVCAVALATANCAGNTQHYASRGGGSDIDPKYGVRASKRLYNEGDVIPKGGGRRYAGKPYVVAGKTYYPRENARGYVREGLASWYGSAFHGRMTANGEVFDRQSIAAAHPTLPLPSYARVTNLENGYSMVVRVNDRGPYHAGRVMDLSEEAARALDFHRKGTAHVRVAYIGRASVAGSDDRKLLATLRTDGRPAGMSSPVMVADLGSDEAAPAPERFARSAQPALAFKPAQEPENANEGTAETAAERAPEPAPARRPAPILMARASGVAVPAAVQPTAPRAAPFRPAPIALARHEPATYPNRPSEPRTTVASAGRNTPLSLAPPPIRQAASERIPAAEKRENGARTRYAAAEAGPVRGIHNAPLQTARAGTPSPTAMPTASKLAMAKLMAAAAPPAPTKAKAGPMPDAKPHRSRFAAVD